MQVEKLSDDLVNEKKRHRAALANTTVEQAEESGQSMLHHYIKLQTESVQMFLNLGMSSDEVSKVKRIPNCKGYPPTMTNDFTWVSTCHVLFRWVSVMQRTRRIRQGGRV